MSVCAIVLTLYYFVYTKITSSKSDATKKIWVPPKAKPTLPFGLGPPAEPIEAKDYEETTYKAQEMKVLKENVTAIGMSILISGFMSIKIESHQALLMQGLMMPFNFYDSVVVKKYLFGKTGAADGGLLYGELFKAPTDASLKLTADVAAAKAALAAKKEAEDEEPKVVELPEESKKEDMKDKKATDAHDID